MALRAASLRGLTRVAQRVYVRGMATEKQIANQIVSTKNISKITASMKMVSAAKLKGDEKRLASAKPYNAWADAICGPGQEIEFANFDDLPQRILVVPMSSDKGLCGGINSYITRATKTIIAKAQSDGKEVDLVVVGDKGRAQLARAEETRTAIRQVMSEVESPATYSLIAQLSADILMCAEKKEYDGIMIVYNSFVNAAVYKQKYKLIKPFEAAGDSESMVEYEFEPDTKSEVLQDMHEYLLTSQMYECFMDGACAEQASRMTAMEGASKNAGEMIEKLTLQYNRARQTRITTELIEIISGASALEDK